MNPLEKRSRKDDCNKMSYEKCYDCEHCRDYYYVTGEHGYFSSDDVSILREKLIEDVRFYSEDGLTEKQIVDIFTMIINKRFGVEE